MSLLDELDLRYTAILCDIWGVVHDGACLLPGVRERLEQFRAEGRTVVLLTNAPRPAETIQAQLDRFGLDHDLYAAITSSGEAGIAALARSRRPVGFIGTADDRRDLISHGVILTEEYFAELACTGLEDPSGDPASYVERLLGYADRGVLMHCLNPDRVVIHQGRREACAGALADLYEGMGGQVVWYGKPHQAIYDHARTLAGNPAKEALLAIGDGLQTDMLGAARYGIDAVFVSHGIHQGEPVPRDFALRHRLGEWHPILTVPGLG